MAVTINADTSNGLVMTPDTSGEIKLQSAGADTVTVDSSGNVGIGTSSPTDTLTVNGGNTSLHSGSWLKFGSQNVLWADATYGTMLQAYPTSDYIAFRSSNGTERMRIDSSGNFLVGTTTGLDGGNGATIKQATYFISSYRVSTTTGNYIHAFYSDVGGTATAKYAIYANGTAGAISDERYKKNIEPARNYLDDLTKINVIKYNWATDDENAPKELGFSAQQVETIFPALVDTVDNKDADGNVLLNQKILKRDVFVPMLIKAIQEQQEQIKALETRIQALENA